MISSGFPTNALPGKFPKSVFLIITTEFCERFSFCGLKTILSLYLRNVLLYPENVATIIYHVFIMMCYFVPIIVAIIADSFLGRFKTIVYFSCVYVFGNIMLSLGAIPPVHLPVVTSTMIGLVLIAIGTGGIKPCVSAFGGDQFRMPQQQNLLKQYFSVFYFTINLGGFIGMLITPILRISVSCFGNGACYALGFGCPAGLMMLALTCFVAGKPLYKIRTPKENILVQFAKCSGYAIIERVYSKKKVKSHWLDYAADKYDPKLIQDMKNVLAILFLYIPLPIFWTLFDQQGSSWTFQASRTDSEILGVHMIPDLMQVLNPAIVLGLIPLFEKVIYPCLDRLDILKGPLKRMGTGAFAAACAFIAAGIVELKLESTYPILPQKNQAHLNFVNLLPCDIQLVNSINYLQVIKAGQNNIFKNVPINLTKSNFEISAPRKCSNIYLETPWKRVGINAHEYRCSDFSRQSSKIGISLWYKNESLKVFCPTINAQQMPHVEPIIITSFNNKIRAFQIDPEQLQKSLSGKPKIRIVTLADENSKYSVVVKLFNKHHKGIYGKNDTPVGITPYTELEPGRYDFTLIHVNGSLLKEEIIHLKLGGVYSLMTKIEFSSHTVTKLFVMTPPNSVHVLWLVPQYLLISIGDVMFAIAGLQFTFTQAPKSMKTVTIAAWYLSVALGNLLVIIITHLNIFKTQAYGFFFYAVLVFVDIFLFVAMATKYRSVVVEADESSSLFTAGEMGIRAAKESINEEHQ